MNKDLISIIVGSIGTAMMFMTIGYTASIGIFIVLIGIALAIDSKSV